jgi:LysM repeat protein
VESLLALNNWSVDWPLQLEQKLLIKAPNWTPTPTDLPLSPIERLTPAADGKYYHVVKDGQNPQWIADYYGISVNDLLAWNFLTKESILYVGNRLVLNITPPATATPLPSPTPVPPTETPQPTSTPRPTATPMATVIPEPTAVIEENSVDNTAKIGLGMAIIVTAGVGGYFLLRFLRNRRS